MTSRIRFYGKGLGLGNNVRTDSLQEQHQPAEALLSRPEALFNGYIFDLDGTLLLGDAVLPGAQRLIHALHALDRRVLYVTNNPTKDPTDVVARLVRDGIPATPEEVINTVSTTIHWLKTHEPDATVFPIAEAPIVNALAQANIRTSENPEEIDFVLASYDRTFEYRKLQIAFDAIHVHKRARLIATNPDRYCPMPGGRGEPDAAAIVGAIEGCTGITCERHFGKPDAVMLETAVERLGVPASACLMVGDRLSTDIQMAHRAGMASALPLTGETTLEMLRLADHATKPTFAMERVDHIMPANIWHDLGWTES
jgi:HAD superfamily hydrolase (TIGR01450 family)